jgi:exodeoxyribonuclease-3
LVANSVCRFRLTVGIVPLREILPALRVRRGGRHFRNAFARDAGLHIDHMLLSPSLASRLVRAEVDRGMPGWEKASDPTWIELAATTKLAATSRCTASVGNRN